MEERDMVGRWRQRRRRRLVILSIAILAAAAAAAASGGRAALLRLENRCAYTVWPGIVAEAGQALLGRGGMELAAGQSAELGEAPPGWSGRIWGRTGCAFEAGTGRGACETGDCGGQLECAGAGGSPPVTLAEFTLAAAAAAGQASDFYDVSLVDGYNVGMAVSPQGGDRAAAQSSSSSTPPCADAGCGASAHAAHSDGDADALLTPGGCPPELAQTDASGRRVVACRSACLAFSSPHFCCTGAFSSPSACSPSSYSRLFKAACPAAYSYAFDDPSSTFTCAGASAYTITFCPSSSSSSSSSLP